MNEQAKRPRAGLQAFLALTSGDNLQMTHIRSQLQSLSLRHSSMPEGKASSRLQRVTVARPLGLGIRPPHCLCGGIRRSSDREKDGTTQ
jgi:hypothetical protein